MVLYAILYTLFSSAGSKETSAVLFYICCQFLFEHTFRRSNFLSCRIQRLCVFNIVIVIPSNSVHFPQPLFIPNFLNCLKGNRNNKTFLQRLRCILWVITLHSTISYYKMRFYTRKTELEASTCQFPRKLRS